MGMFAVGIAVALGLSIAGQNWTAVYVLVGVAGFGVGGQQIVLNYLIVGAYPTALRATAAGWSIGMGRAGAILGSSIGGVFLSMGGPQGFFVALSVPLIGAGIAVLSLRLNHSTAGAAPATAH